MSKAVTTIEKKNVPASTELVTVPGTAHIAVYRPAEVEVYDDVVEGEDTGVHGQDGPKRLPIFRILQANSPQVKKGLNSYIPGAKEGDFINTITNEVFDGERGLYFVAARKHLKYPQYIEREDDGSGGGFLGIFEPEAPEVRKAQAERMQMYNNLLGPLPFGQTDDGKNIQLVETQYIDSVAIVPNEDGSFPGEFGTTFDASFAFSSTFLKAFGSWKDRLPHLVYNIKKRSGEIGPAEATLWTHVWHIRSKIRARGTQTWMQPLITLGGKDANGAEMPYKMSKLARNDFLYIKAERLREEILEGHVELDFSKDTAARGDAPPAQGGGEQDEIPFPKD